MNKIYIELDEAINTIRNLRGNCDHRFYDEGLMDACSELYGLKPVDVAPVVRATWKLNTDGSGTCSNCHFTQQAVWDDDHWQRYCGVCGALMTEEPV